MNSEQAHRMIDLKWYYETTGLGVCLISNEIKSYMFPESEFENAKKIKELSDKLSKKLKFESGVIEINKKKYIVFRICDSVLISPVSNKVGYWHYTIQKKLKELEK